jgi:hypothetical protein
MFLFFTNVKIDRPVLNQQPYNGSKACKEATCKKEGCARKYTGER